MGGTTTKRRRKIRPDPSEEVTITTCQACLTGSVECTYYENVDIGNGRYDNKWLCCFCSGSILGTVLVRIGTMSAHGGFHIDPVLARGLIQCLHVMLKELTVVDVDE